MPWACGGLLSLDLSESKRSFRSSWQMARTKTLQIQLADGKQKGQYTVDDPSDRAGTRTEIDEFVQNYQEEHKRKYGRSNLTPKYMCPHSGDLIHWDSKFSPLDFLQQEGPVVILTMVAQDIDQSAGEAMHRTSGAELAGQPTDSDSAPDINTTETSVEEAPVRSTEDEPPAPGQESLVARLQSQDPNAAASVRPSSLQAPRDDVGQAGRPLVAHVQDGEVQGCTAEAAADIEQLTKSARFQQSGPSSILESSEMPAEEQTSAGTGVQREPKPSQKRRNKAAQKLVESQRGPTAEELRKPDDMDQQIFGSDLYKLVENMHTPALTGERSIESGLQRRQRGWSFHPVRFFPDGSDEKNPKKKGKVGDVGQNFFVLKVSYCVESRGGGEK